MDDQSPSATRAIEIRIEDISQLFHSLDPFPFRERDLDDDAEEFIVSWAREIPADQPLKIIVPLPDTQASRQEAKELGAAMTRSTIAPTSSRLISKNSSASAPSAGHWRHGAHDPRRIFCT
jgi:hypothetical protein